METISITNGYMYKFSAEKLLVERIYNQVKQLDFNPDTVSSQSDDLYYDKELFDWFSICIKQVAGKLLLPKELNFPITSCWANRIKKLGMAQHHNHGNSFVSGIFYLTDATKGGQTVFTTPNLYEQNFKWLSFEAPAFPPVQFTVNPEQGTLLLFPSCLQHKVNTVQDTTDRLSIAFNVFISGNLGNGKAKTFLNIKSKSVEERIKEL